MIFLSNLRIENIPCLLPEILISILFFEIKYLSTEPFIIMYLKHFQHLLLVLLQFSDVLIFL